MSVSFRCRCGQRVRVASDDDTVECPACGRTVFVARPRGDRRELWLALATVVTLLAIAGLGVLVAAQVKSRKAGRDDVAQAKEQPAPKVVTPEPPRKQPQPVGDWVDVPVEEFGIVSPQYGIPTAPPPRPVVTPVPVVPTAPAPPDPKRAGELDTVFIEPAGRYKVGSTFGQEVVVTRRSAFRVAGMDFTQGSQCAFASSFVVTKVNRDGSFVTEQTVV